MPPNKSLNITILYDNNSYDESLKSAWGFAALVKSYRTTVLFDTGGDGSILLENMFILGIDPTQIESVVLSHNHRDHTGGLSALLEAGSHPTVYLIPSFPTSFKKQVARTTKVIKSLPGMRITEGMFTTGELRSKIPEQALVVQTDQGLVVITGCAHPGVVEIVEHALYLSHELVRLVMGGFHLEKKNKAELSAILDEFRRLRVKQVAPCHCTGEPAKSMFAEDFGEDYVKAGVGKVIVLRGRR